MKHNINTSIRLFKEAQTYIPGGVNSPVRSFYAMGGNPLFIKRGEQAYLVDADNNRYIDYICSWGVLIFGHAYPPVLNAVNETVTKGLSFGAPTELEIKMAKKICSLMPNIEMVRMVNSGTEATMTALRLARAYTKRDKIIKFTGCYHGHNDALLINAGSGALTLGVPSSPGVPTALAADTLVADFNDLNTVTQLFERYPNEIAAVILEPIAGNMNFVPADPNFLKGIRELCNDYQSVLIFDEVMTGFRIGLGGAQHYYGIKPDLTALSKIIGGGFPVGAFGGKKEIMKLMAPSGPVYQAGTLSGNPVAMAAGYATLTALEQPGVYETLSRLTERFMKGLKTAADAQKVPLVVNHLYGMFGFFFTNEEKITHYNQVIACDQAYYKKFFHEMLNRGVYLAPSAFEAGFMSTAHTDEDIDNTLNAAEATFKALK